MLGVSCISAKISKLWIPLPKSQRISRKPFSVLNVESASPYTKMAPWDSYSMALLSRFWFHNIK